MHELHLSDYGSTWQVPALPIPEESATKEEIMAFVHNQLDRMEASPHHNVLLGGLVLHGDGPRDRLEGGARLASTLLLTYSYVTVHVLFAAEPRTPPSQLFTKRHKGKTPRGKDRHCYREC